MLLKFSVESKGNIGKGKVIEAVDLGKVAFGFGYMKE